MICTRCLRYLKRPPVLIEGHPYGPKCAAAVPRAPQPAEPDLLTGIDIDGAALVARQAITQTIEASAARHVAEMRAGWGH